MAHFSASDDSIGGFHVTPSPPCWWTKTIDLSLAPFVRPPAFVRFTIVICVSRDWLQTTHSLLRSRRLGTSSPFLDSREGARNSRKVE